MVVDMVVVVDRQRAPSGCYVNYDTYTGRGALYNGWDHNWHYIWEQ